MDIYAGEESIKKWVKGSCHCGKIRYEANIKTKPDGAIKTIRCNCTFCQKLGSGNIPLDNNGPDNFKLVEPASRDEISHYGNGTFERYFCPKCSVFLFADGYYLLPDSGKRVDHIYLNIASIDQPQEGVDLSKIVPVYLEGITFNNPERERNFRPSPSPYSGGLP